MTEWIEWKWTPEKPYPETLETMVQILMVGDDGQNLYDAEPVKNRIWKDSDITHYRLASENKA